ncbi:MAG: autotransporter domain-containing protein, partial [Desulfovibrio sp.]|nr:autotransporter domain-containing protein [Desulfovibrio sp.]
IRLTGMGSYAISVWGNLAISENGDTRLGDISVGGETIISGGSVQARQFKATGNAVFNNTELTLLGTGERGSSFGDDLTITANTKSSLGDATVAGNMSATGGALTAGVLRANKNANFTGVELELGGSMSTPSEIGGDLSFVSNKSAKLGAITINGGLTADSGDLTATSLKVDKDANFDGVRLALNGVADNPDKIGGNLILSGDSVATTGSLEVGGELRAGGGSFKSARLKTGSGADFTGVDLALNGTEANPDLIGGDFNLAKNAKANLSYIEIGGKATVDGGDFTAKKLSAGAADFSNTKSDVSSLDIKGVAEFAGGSFSADNAKTGSAIFREGIIASLKNMMLVDSGGTINVGDAMDTEGGTTVKIDALNLAGGTLKIGNIDVGPALVAVNGFAKGDGSADIINGHIAVGANGRLALGTKDGSWIPANLAEARATLALAQPTRLAAGTGMHVTGTGAPAPVGGRINFDADSLFIIDGANARTYYTGEWVKSALLDSSKGAVGALSSESSHTAVVADGARLYIKNPVPNTVIVALGQNIKTVYANSATRNRATTGAAWTGANLDYDNKDTVKIERLDGEYAGQFSVLPRDTTPTDPGQPDNPDQPSTPSTPENPDQPSPTPDNPSDPANPDNPSNNPSSPDAPAVAPSKPANTTHPAADPGIHDVIDHESGKGNIGDKPEHLVWHHGAGFISHTIANENPREATRLVEGAARIAVIGAVPQMTLLGNEAASSASERRVGIENMIWRDDDFHARSVSLWAVPLYRATGAWDMEAGNLDYDYHGGIGGVALGGDITFDDLIRAGLAFHIGGGYAKSEGELSETTNNMNFWGVGAYAGWIRDNFAVSADVNFTSTYNKLKQDVSSLPGWGELKGDARAYALSAGMKFEYKFETDLADIIPHAGFKYHYIHVYDYDINHRGSTIMSGEAFEQNIWTFPIGIKFAKNLELENGWTLRPSLDLRAIPAAGDIDAKTSIRFTETSRDIDLKTKTMDYIVWGGAIGLEATFGNLALGINYSLDAGAQSVANSVFGVVRYEF